MKGSTKKIRFGIALNVLAATSLFLVLILSASPASAIPMNANATLRFELTGGAISYPGTTTIIIEDVTPEFNLYNNGQPVTGEGHLGVLVPNGTATISNFVNIGTLDESIPFSSGKLGDADNLGVAGLTDYEFAALASASAQVGIPVGSFTAYDWNLGGYSEGIDGINFIAPLPAGTVIVAWVQSTTSELGNALTRTPLSESLTVPEPTTLLLLGAGLVGLGLFGRKRFKRR